jgi:hypothetical protein
MTSPSSTGALEAVERILNRGGDNDEVLRQVVDTLHERAAAWVGIAFMQHDRVELGPTAGGGQPDVPQRHPIAWQGRTIAELWTSDDADRALCSRIALIISPYCRR